MAEFSKIAWTTHTFNPWIGCSRVSEGCLHCYAENLMANRYKRVEWGPGKPRSKTKTWGDPIRWHKEANKPGAERPRIFCASLADYLDEEVDESWRKELFSLIERCYALDWLLLTKRIKNAQEMLPKHWLKDPLPHVWYGVTAENQKRWDERVPILRKLPAIGPRWISYEPSIGPLNMTNPKGIDWVIVGGESNQDASARPFGCDWARSIIRHGKEIGMSVFVKQMGSNAYDDGERLSIKDKAGADPEEWPADLRVREFPQSGVGVRP